MDKETKKNANKNMWFITITCDDNSLCSLLQRYYNSNRFSETYLTTKYIERIQEEEHYPVKRGRQIMFKYPVWNGPMHYQTECYPVKWKITSVKEIPMRNTLLDLGLNDDIIRLIMRYTYADDLTEVPEEWVKSF